MGVEDFLPESLKHRLFDGIVERLAQTAEAFSPNAGNYFRSLKSDSEFKRAFAEALAQAMSAFQDEFSSIDAGLATALLRDNGWLGAESVVILESIMSRPGSHIDKEIDDLIEKIVSYFDGGFSSDRIRLATNHLLRALSREVLHIPHLQTTYGIQASIMTAKNTAHIAQAVQTMQQDLRGLTQVLLPHPLPDPSKTILTPPLLLGSTDAQRGIPRVDDQVIPQKESRRLRSRRDYVLTCMELLKATRTYRAIVVGPLLLHPPWYSERRAGKRQLPDYERFVFEFVRRECAHRNGDIRFIFRNTSRYVAKVDELIRPKDRPRFKADLLANIDLIWGHGNRGPDLCCQDTGYIRVELIFDAAVVESYRPRADAPITGGRLILDPDTVAEARARFDDVFDGGCRGQVAEIEKLKIFVRELWT